MKRIRRMIPFSDIRSRAQNLVDEASRAISDAKIKEKAQTIWDSVVNLFR